MFGIGGTKVTVQEWGIEANKLKKRALKKKVSVKYRSELDAFCVDYKNATVPVKHNYIVDGIFNIVNVENSFIPINLSEMDITIDHIDKLANMGKDSTDAERQVAVKEAETSIKACAIPMEIRGWFITNARRIMTRREGWFQKYGNVVVIMLFMSFSIAMVYVVFEQSRTNIESTTVAVAHQFFDRIHLQMLNETTAGFTNQTTVAPP